MRKIVLIVMTAAVLALKVSAQTTPQFTGDTATFTGELKAFFGTLVNKSEMAEIDRFIALYDSTVFLPAVKHQIINVASQLRGRRVSQRPGFIYFLRTLTDFIETSQKPEEAGAWLTGLSEILFDPRYTNSSVEKFMEITGLMLVDNVIYSAGSVRWRAREGRVEFVRDTILKVNIEAVTMSLFLGRDSATIFNFSGVYYPDLFQLYCREGTVTWQKAGYDPSQVFALVTDFTIDVTRSEYTCDSALLTHPTYFRQPVKGKLTDRAVAVTSPEKATMPRFETYETRFYIDNIYKGVDYEGGLSLEGAIVRGTGTDWFPANIKLYRQDTLAMKITSRSFILSRNEINSYESSPTLYLGRDSIYHSNLGFTYKTESGEVSLFRTSSPLSRSPYFDSYHNLDLYFEHLSWNMNEPRIIMSRTRGSSIGSAKFESVSFYNEANFFRLMRLDDTHPLYRVRDFAKVYGFDIFPVESFARWLRISPEQATALCIELANNGFLFYDRNFNEVAVKPKVDDYIAAFAKKKDYDAIAIFSETRDEQENAILNLSDYTLDIWGVRGVSLSDSQNVAFRPYGGHLTIGHNRSIKFNGMVHAGLFTIYGKEFAFDYDTFNIRLEKIDSIKIAVETDERDGFGRPLIKPIDNMIEQGSANLLIDDPRNKSGLRRMVQYPMIQSTSDSYIYYDEITNLDGLYPKESFYFKLDPFTYTNIDHYRNEDLSLEGLFVGGGIIEPMRQTLTVQPDTSLGFAMVIPPEGIPLYDGRGRLYNHLSMSSSGLIGSGRLEHLTANVVSDTFRLFPDFMYSRARSFDLHPDPEGRFPELHSTDTDIQWIAAEDEWHALNSPGNEFTLYANGTTLDGELVLKQNRMTGAGDLNTTDARITSETFSFRPMSFDADTSDYYLRALKDSGYGFVASNARTHVDFATNKASFVLNTDSSFVVLPGIEYLSKMTNFEYDMDKRIMEMSQKGRETVPLMPPEELLKVARGKVEKPTFLATNNMKDTLKFQSGSASYNLNEEYLMVRDVNYIPVADALIQPPEGVLYIERGARVRPTGGAYVAVNNRYLLHSARLSIESSAKYGGSGKYDWVSDDGSRQVISFSEIRVDTMATKALGYIPASDNFTLSPAFSYSGDVTLRSDKDHLIFTGAAGIISDCGNIISEPVRFTAQIDPQSVLIPISDKARSDRDDLLFSGTFVTLDSAGVYGTFLSERHSWSDNPMLTATGYLFYDKGSNRYRIASLEKLSDLKRHGNMVTLDRNMCLLLSEGKTDLGVRYDLATVNSAGTITHNTDSARVEIRSILAFSFHFSQAALKAMADEIRTNPTLKTVNLSSEFNTRAMRDLIGEEAARKLNEELQLFGVARSLPREYTAQLLLNDVTLQWNPWTMSFISRGQIGVGFIGERPMNIYVDGWVELQRRRSGDQLDIYLKAGNNSWYWFSYARGVMMTYSSNSEFNDIIGNTKEKLRRDPKSSARVRYEYLLGVPERVRSFVRRMESGGMADDLR